MIKKSGKINPETRKAQMALQNREIAETLGHIKNKILVMSGKGGVGKSSVAAYLSVALAKRGYQVGLMDVDLHGPDTLKMLGREGEKLRSNGTRLSPWSTTTTFRLFPSPVCCRTQIRP